MKKPESFPLTKMFAIDAWRKYQVFRDCQWIRSQMVDSWGKLECNQLKAFSKLFWEAVRMFNSSHAFEEKTWSRTEVGTIVDLSLLLW